MQTLLKNGTVYDVHTGTAKKADVLVRDGIIAAVGPSLPVPGGPGETSTIDAAGQTIYPGLIDAHTHIGTLFEAHTDDCNECSNPSTPTMRIVDALRYDDPCLLQNARAGITTACITPGSGNAVCGQAAIIKTWAPRPFHMIVNDYAAFKLAFGENPKSVYGVQKKLPMSRMGTASIIRSFFERGRLYQESRAKGGDANLDLEPALPVLEGKVPVKIHCHRADDIFSAIRIARSFGLRFTLDHCTEGYLVADELVAAGAPIMVGPLFWFRTKPELRNADPFQAISLNEKGLLLSLISDHNVTDSRYLAVWAGELVKRGLPRDAAIRMLTINPARALGIEDRLGSLDAGKDADLFLVDGDPLEIRTTVTLAMIRGQIVPAKSQEAAK